MTCKDCIHALETAEGTYVCKWEHSEYFFEEVTDEAQVCFEFKEK